MIALFFDTETTGFKSSTFTPEIVQIGAILQDTVSKRVLAELNVIVTPKNPIPEKVSAIHGITDDLAARYGIDPKQAENLFGVMGMMADVIVAHNISFDMGILEGTWPVAYNTLLPKDPFCTMRESTDILKMAGGNYHGQEYAKNKPPKLAEAYAHFFDGKTFENAHDAMADVRACRDVYFAIKAHLEKAV